MKAIRCAFGLFVVIFLVKNYKTAFGQTFDIESGWNANFSLTTIQIHMNTLDEVILNITDEDKSSKTSQFQIKSEDPLIASSNFKIKREDWNIDPWIWSGKINISGNFLGKSKIYVERINDKTTAERSNNSLNVIVIRQMRIIDHVFTGSVALLVSLLYINFGAALDLDVVTGILSRPIGPIICFCTQYILMPLLSFGLGYAVFAKNPELLLGLFFTGVSPGGGASNMWTVLLEGNLNLSIIMTTISNIAAFAMMPFWLFTLGKIIFEQANIIVPYTKITTFVVALIIPLTIGLIIQKYSPRLTRLLVRLLKPISSVLIIFIIVFATVTNLYLFELFSWRIIVAGLGLPWFGYCLSWIVAKLLKQTPPDALTIAIETGIQNTGIAIFLLRFSLPQPEADLTTVVPVSVAIMTPLPLLCIYIFKRFFIRKPDPEVERMITEQAKNVRNS